MKVLKYFFAFPLLLTAILFGIAHRAPVLLTYSPLHDPVDVPLYLVAFTMVGIGFLIGSVATWFGMAAQRQERRAFKKEVKALENDLSCAGEDLDSARQELADAQKQNRALKYDGDDSLNQNKAS